MGEAERNEFIVDANVVEGKFDADKLLKMYARDELTDWMGADALADIPSEWLDRQVKAHVLSRDIDYQDLPDGKGIDIYAGWHCVGRVSIKEG